MFNRIAQALAQDVVAVLPTAGADDPEGCEAAASAVHRSVASGAAAGDAAAATRRVEQGLRRLGTAIDKSSPAAACETHELLEMLATYVQAGTMLARTRANRDDGDDEGRGERRRPTDDVEAPMDVEEEEAVVQSGASSGCMDLVQSERASRATWRLVDALAPLDPGVAAAAKVVHRNGRNGRTSHTGHDGRDGHDGHDGPDAPAVAAAALACVKRALAALPTDHLRPVFPGGDSLADLSPDAFPGLDGDPSARSAVDAVAEELAKEYALRKETVARRAGLTVTSFSYSKRLRGTPEVSRDFLRRAGAGGAQAQGRDGLPGIGRSPTLADARRAKVADLARCVLRTNAEAHRTLDASVKRVLIGTVPDRGGRTEEARGGGGGGGNMPAFTARVAGGTAGGGATHHGGGRGARGGRGGSQGGGGRRGGGGRGRGGRGGRR